MSTTISHGSRHHRTGSLKDAPFTLPNAIFGMDRVKVNDLLLSKDTVYCAGQTWGCSPRHLHGFDRGQMDLVRPEERVSQSKSMANIAPLSPNPLTPGPSRRSTRSQISFH